MKKEEQLLRDVTEMIKLTKEGKIAWDIQCQTTEYNDAAKKPIEREDDGTEWVVDECFVSYHCEHRGKEFLMITYEQIFTCGEKTKTINMVFLPPLGVRFFDVDLQAPYAIEADQMVLYEIHQLWLTILEQYKKDPQSIRMDVTGRELVLS
jgi:hypothetical protein